MFAGREDVAGGVGNPSSSSSSPSASLARLLFRELFPLVVEVVEEDEEELWSVDILLLSVRTKFE